jgi:hypothetical protein
MNSIVIRQATEVNGEEVHAKGAVNSSDRCQRLRFDQ